MVGGEARGGDDGGQARSGGGAQAVAGVFKGQALPGTQAQGCKHLQVDLGVGLFHGRGGGIAYGAEVQAPVAAYGAAQQGRDVHRRGGGGNGQLQAGPLGLVHEAQHAGAQADLAAVDGFGVVGGLERVDAAQRVLHGLAVQGAHLGVHLLPVVLHPLLAAGDGQQFAVAGLVPHPAQAEFGKGLVEGGQVGAFGVGQGAVHIKNQRLQGWGSHPVLVSGWGWIRETLGGEFLRSGFTLGAPTHKI